MYKKMLIMTLAASMLCMPLAGCRGDKKNDAPDTPEETSIGTESNIAPEITESDLADTELGTDSTSEGIESDPAQESTEDSAEDSTNIPSEDPIDSLKIERGINVSTLEYEGFNKTVRMSLRDPFTQETFANIKAQGFDHVRLPVNFAANYKDGKVKEDFLEELDGIIGMILGQGLTVVLDFHGWQAINSDVKSNEEMFYSIWEQVAEHYKDHPNELLFEIINEPHQEDGSDPLNAENLNRIQLKAIEIIRKTNPKRILVMAGPEWNTHWGIKDLELPKNDRNLIVDMHTYQPLDFTHQGSELWMDASADRTTVEIYDKVYEEIDTVARVCRDFTARTGIKVWLGEFGMVVSVPKSGTILTLTPETAELVSIAKEEDVTAYVSYVTEKMEEAGVPWAWWEYDLEFGAYDLIKKEWRDFVIDGLMPQG